MRPVVTIDGELRAIKAVARQLRGATAPPQPRQVQSWARSLDDAVRGLERGVRFLREGREEPLSAAVEPATPAPGTDRPGGGSDAAQRRREVRLRRVQQVPKPGTGGRAILDAVAAVARDPRTVGLTDWQLAEITGLAANTVRPRRGELVTGGWLLDSGHTREHHGTAHRVWVLSDKAAAAVAG
jgi:hypothetical protein